VSCALSVRLSYCEGQWRNLQGAEKTKNDTMFFRIKIHAKAIIIGVASGFVLGLLVAPLETLLLFGPSLTGTPLHIASLVFGSFATLFAAYLTAHMSPTDKLANVLIFWGINQLLGILSLFFLTFPFWYNVAGTSTVFLASMLGWYLEKLTGTQKNHTKLPGIEKNIQALMGKFTTESHASTDKSNYDALKEIHSQLMKSLVSDELGKEEPSPFLRNFLEEFDNTYADGLPEAIVTALKTGKRVDLTNDWRSKKRSS
jgi:hypothetical protein